MTEPPLSPLAARHARLRGLLHKMGVAMRSPAIAASPITEGALDFLSAAVTLPNGIVLIVSLDADLPDALFEVVRLPMGAGDTRLDFEIRDPLGVARAGKLTSDHVLQLVTRYGARPAPPR